MRIDRKTFFSGYREAFGSLDGSQVEGLEFLLGKLESDTFTLKQCAYILATIQHETGVVVGGKSQMFQPIKELRGKTLTAAQRRYWPSGYYGRGYVQITWDYNYEKFGILDTPEKALEPETAYMIASKGMRRGLFTGNKLSDYINGKADYRNARKIINGLDKADHIAANARKFEAILESASNPSDAEKPADIEKGVTTSTKPAEETEGTPPPAPAAEIKASKPSLFTRLGSLSIPAGAMTALAAVGKFVQTLPPWAWVAIIGMALVIGYLIWRDSKRHAHERTLKVMDAAASKDLNNLRLI